MSHSRADENPAARGDVNDTDERSVQRYDGGSVQEQGRPEGRSKGRPGKTSGSFYCSSISAQELVEEGVDDWR